MEEVRAKTWLEKMIEREALPKAARTETTIDFCKREGVESSTYYYALSKEENQKKILELSLNAAKNELPEVLDSLLKNAKCGKEKSIEMYLDYVIKLAKNLDIKSDGKPLISIDSAIAARYALEPRSTTDSERHS